MTPPLASAVSFDTPRRPDAFRLSGPTAALDPRTHAYRSDLADITLAGTRFAPHYTKAEPARCTAPAAMMLASPSEEAPAVSQLVHGEPFALLDRSGGWAWGRSVHDGYVGYIRDEALGGPEPAAWRVVAPLAPAFSSASIKAPVRLLYPVGALLSGPETGDFVRAGGCFVHRRHVAPAAEPAGDWVAAAERLVGLPYLWGGRGAGGIDCSGLVQVALGLAGIPAPRDSDQQRESLGEPLADSEILRRGDLVFLPGHVGIMVDGDRVLHANAFWMAVTIEPLADLLARTGPQQAVTRRRLVP